MRAVILVISLLSLLSASAQQIEIVGKIVEEESGTPIENLGIYCPEYQKGTFTNRKGEFSLKLPKVSGATLQLASLGYESKTIALDDFKNKIEGSILKLEIGLRLNIYELTGPTITTKPDTVYGSKEYHVGDFCFMGDKMLLLVYEKEDRWKRQELADKTLYQGCKLVLLDQNKREVSTLRITSIAIGFYTDYLSEVFLETEDGKFHVGWNGSSLLLSAMDSKEFQELIEPVKDSVGDLVYLSNYQTDFPAFEYFIYNKKDSTFHTMKYVVDEPLMRLFRSEYKYLDYLGKLEAFRYEIKSGIDKEIVAAYMSGFAESLYYEPLYAPLFLIEDTAVVFDYYSNKLYKYTDLDQLVDSVGIDYHEMGKRKEWQKKMVQDEETGEIYALFKRNGWYYLKAINTSNGEVISSFKLLHRYAEKIKVKNGWAYYVYRPFESAQRKFLYKERILPQDFVTKNPN